MTGIGRTIVRAAIAAIGLIALLCVELSMASAELLDDVTGTVEETAGPVVEPVVETVETLPAVVEPEPVIDMPSGVADQAVAPAVQPVATVIEPDVTVVEPVAEPVVEPRVQPVADTVDQAANSAMPSHEPAIDPVLEVAVPIVGPENASPTGQPSLTNPPASAVGPTESVPSAAPVIDTLDIFADALPVDGAPVVTDIAGGLSGIDFGGASEDSAPLLPDFSAIPDDLDFVEYHESLPTADLIKPDALGIVTEPVGVTLDHVLQPVTPVASHVAPHAQAVPDTLVPALVSPVTDAVVEPEASGLQPLTPALESVTPLVEPVLPVLNPVMALTEPVATVVEPVGPILEPIAPVADVVAPVLEPMLESIVPVMEPELVPVRPVVEHMVEPILLHVDPALAPVAPVVEPVLEIAVPVLTPIVTPVVPTAGPDPVVAPVISDPGPTSAVVDEPPTVPGRSPSVADADVTLVVTEREASTGPLSFRSGPSAADVMYGRTEPIAGHDTLPSMPSISFGALIQSSASTAADTGMQSPHHATSRSDAIAPIPPAPTPSPQGGSAPATLPLANALGLIATESVLSQLVIRIPSSIHQSVLVPPG